MRSIPIDQLSVGDAVERRKAISETEAAQGLGACLRRRPSQGGFGGGQSSPAWGFGGSATVAIRTTCERSRPSGEPKGR